MSFVLSVLFFMSPQQCVHNHNNQFVFGRHVENNQSHENANGGGGGCPQHSFTFNFIVDFLFFTSICHFLIAKKLEGRGQPHDYSIFISIFKNNVCEKKTGRGGGGGSRFHHCDCQLFDRFTFGFDQIKELNHNSIKLYIFCSYQYIRRTNPQWILL